MTSSTGKTIGLIFVILFILLIFIQMTPLSLKPLNVFHGQLSLFKGPPVFRGPENWTLSLAHLIPLIILTALWITMILWVYRDSERKGMNGILWALLVFIGSVVGLLIYLIIRSDMFSGAFRTVPADPCPNCRKPMSSNYVFCPHCGTPLKASCPKCKRPIETDWRICPVCGEALVKKGKEK